MSDLDVRIRTPSLTSDSGYWWTGSGNKTNDVAAATADTRWIVDRIIASSTKVARLIIWDTVTVLIGANIYLQANRTKDLRDLDMAMGWGLALRISMYPATAADMGYRVYYRKETR